MEGGVWSGGLCVGWRVVCGVEGGVWDGGWYVGWRVVCGMVASIPGHRRNGLATSVSSNQTGSEGAYIASYFQLSYTV